MCTKSSISGPRVKVAAKLMPVGLLFKQNIIEKSVHTFLVDWQQINISSGIALVPSGSKPLPKVMLTKFHDDM